MKEYNSDPLVDSFIVDAMQLLLNGPSKQDISSKYLKKDHRFDQDKFG